MTREAGLRPAGDAVVRSLTEREVAEWRIERGERVVERDGRYWRMSRPGFWEPVHWLARLPVAFARRPAAGLGFRATLRPEDAASANGWMPAHVLSPVSAWGLHTLSRNRRHRLRKALRRVDLVELGDQRLLEEEGYAVVVSSLARTGAGDPPSRDAYARTLTRDGIGRELTFFAGLLDGHLAGYIGGWAVDGTAYFQRLHIHTDALASQVGTALVVAFVEACQRAGDVEEVVNGLHSREFPELTSYKEAIGFPVRRYPLRLAMPPGALFALRRLRPHVAYRLTGE